MDHLVTLATQISTSFVLRQHLVAIFFDIEKAYDTTWRYGILRTLHTWGLRGRLPLFLVGFLSSRSFRVRLGDTLSSSHQLENGVPQGSILSVTLFAIAINSIASVIREPVKASLFVDDFAIFCSSKSMQVIERQLQLVLNKLQQWSDETGFKFSASKTNCMHFCRIHHLHNHPDLFLGGQQLQFVESATFLGLTFDKSLTWRKHIRKLQSRCVSPLNLLRTLTGSSWGADRVCLLRLYRTLIRPILDYGCIVYGSASPSTLRPLNTIHNAGIRISTGAYRTSRIECLLAEAGEPSLSRRRDILIASYGAKLSNIDTPSRQAVLHPTHLTSYALRPSLPHPLGVRLRMLLQKLNIKLPNPVKLPRNLVPPWKLHRPIIDLRLSNLSKSLTPPSTFLSEFEAIKSTYPGHYFIYTDGSSQIGKVGCAFYCRNATRSFRLNSSCSVYTAEKFALLEALKFAELKLLRKVVICCDSKSALESISSFTSCDPLTMTIQHQIHHLLVRRYILVFCWVPGHVGIRGNEIADQAAKSATKKRELDIFTVPTEDTKLFIKRSILSEWQTEWQNSDFKLTRIKDSIYPWSSSSRDARREEIILTRLRIGHCHLSHGYLLRGDPPPICEYCKIDLTVEHILLHCGKIRESRRRHGLGGTLAEILRNDESSLCKLFSFLRETNLYRLI